MLNDILLEHGENLFKCKIKWNEIRDPNLFHIEKYIYEYLNAKYFEKYFDSSQFDKSIKSS